MNLLTILIIYSIILAVLLALVCLFIYQGVGFRNAWVILKVKWKRKKGWGVVKMRSVTSYPRLIPYKFDGSPTIRPLGDGNGEYNFMKKFIYLNEYDLPTIEYMEGEAEPIDFRSGLVTITSAKAQENIVAGAVQARQYQANSELMQFIKKYGIYFLIIFAVVIGAIIFMYLRNADTLDVCLQNAGRTILLNTTSIGK